MTAAVPHDRPVRVLVVDDEPDHRVLIERRLESIGASVTHAETAEEAFEIIEGGQHDVMLLDYRLPGMNGLDLLSKLPAVDRPAVIMVTGMGSETVAVDALRGGAADYLVKDREYLEKLPGVVRRAWVHHDLSRRAGELQRLALLVSSAPHEVVFDEIVGAARSLLRADAAVLFGCDETRVLSVSGIDREDERLASLAGELRERVSCDDPRTALYEPVQQLVLPLAEQGGEIIGALALLSAAPRGYSAGELSFAETFGGFAAIAIGHHTRLELQRSLVAHLEQAADARRRLLAAVSHELKTPLTCISGFTETLLCYHDRIDEEQQLDFLRRVRSHATELAELVEQLLDAAAAQGAPLAAEIGRVPLPDEVAAAVDALAPLLAERPVEVDVPPVTVRGDRVLLRRALTNLLSNAVKYSPLGTTVTVSATVEGSRVSIAVTDRGVGMTQEEMERVFEPFWRAPAAASSAARGTGVGLALVREYARAMDGSISVRSRPGEGSTFTLRLPLEEG